MLHFQYLDYLWILAALPVIILGYMYLRRWKKRAKLKIGDPTLVNELTQGYSAQKFLAKCILFCLAFGLCVLAVAGLVKPDGAQRILRKGTDIMVALDVSKSMLATDIKPNRLERAKQLVSRVMDGFPDHRIGLVIFAGRAYLQMPLTSDHEAARMYLGAASPDDVPTQGTVISDALRMSFAAFNPKEKTYKSILLISDGEDHDDGALKVAKQLSKQGIMINTIGIGSPQGAPIPDETTGQYKINAQGETIISRLNEKVLRDIAKDGNGIYQLLNDPDIIVKNLKNKLSHIESEATLSDSSYASFKQYYMYFLAAAFLLLLVEFFVSDRKRLARKPTFMLILALGISGFTFGQQGNQMVREGNKAFKQGKFDQAEKDYRKALEKSGENVKANFNLGNTLYRKDKTDEAVQYYDQAITHTGDPDEKQQAYYNKGVAYQKANKLDQSILAYKNALLLNPNDSDARQNLQRALKKKKEQQQQQQKQKQNKKDKKSPQDKKNQKQKQQQKPEQYPARISKQDALEKLKTLLQNEKELQRKLKKIKGVPSNPPEKDW